MKKTIFIIISLMVFALVTGTRAKDKAEPEKKAPALTDEDKEVVKHLEMLKLMKLLKDMEMLKDYDLLAEGKNNEKGN